VSTGLRYAIAFVVPLTATLLLTPFAARLAHRAGIIDRPRDGRFSTVATPYLGGLAVAGGLVTVALVTTHVQAQLLVIVLGAIALGGLGLVDDWRPQGPTLKLLVESCAGLALWIAGVRAGFFGIEVLDLLLTIAWVVVVTNAVNLLDNMDGVASGVVAISAFGFFAIAASEGDYLVASLALTVCGASLAFLRYNFPPAKIFLGDAGTLMLGFLLAALGLKLDLMGPSALVRAVVPALMLAVPLFDMALVVAARTRDGRPVFLGGTDHTAHRLASSGLSVRVVAISAYLVQAICCVLAFLLSTASDGALTIAGAAVAAVSVTAWILLLRLETSSPLSAADGDPARTTPERSAVTGAR